jgi:MFS family permease
MADAALPHSGTLAANNSLRAKLSSVPWKPAVAVVPILATVYQTLVLTDLTDDVIRLGINGEHYSMIWTNATWGVAIIFGIFLGIWGMTRFGSRDTLIVGLVWFAAGNFLCGAAVDVPTMVFAKAVEGIGKGLVIMLCRSTLYRQFDKMVIVAMAFYGVVAYATRPTTPLLMALVNDATSWRWIFWLNVPLALLAIPLVRVCFKPDRPPKPLPLKISWGAVTLFAAWIVSIVFICGWYRKWGGWTSNAFALTALFAVIAPVILAGWLGAGSSMSEHLMRILRSRGYALAMCVRMLMLVQLLAVLTLVAKYGLALRDYPRNVTGWLLAAASLTMAISTILTFVYRHRALRHIWLLVAVVGCAACLWWMSSLDQYSSKYEVALMIGCWGLFVGLFPPVFLQDEVESLDKRDALYAGALAVLGIILPMVIIPTTTSNVISAWADRAADAQLMNLQENRPEVESASLRIADYYIQRGVELADAKSLTGAVLGGQVKADAVTHGIQSGLRYLSIVVGGLGLVITGLLMQYQRTKSP